jgi:hypothetical protein
MRWWAARLCGCGPHWVPFACFNHESSGKDYGLFDAHLNETMALVIRSLLLGIYMQDEIILYI